MNEPAATERTQAANTSARDDSAIAPAGWLEHRTGIRTLFRNALYERIPGGARWRYVWGSTLVSVFALQVVTGVLLMTAYSPSAQTAWSSVWYIQTQMTAGWLIRGLHHFGSQAMIILLPIHVLQVVLAGAYRPPREFNWWIGILLLLIVLGLSLTGYLLPWDQKGYWATKVATNIMGLTPLVGEHLQQLVVGGVEYGHATLTRFYAMHVVVLPGLLALLTCFHIALFRRHGVTVSRRHADASPGCFWPSQLLRDTATTTVVFALVFAMTWYTHAYLGQQLLDAPADPSSSDYPARPEWYFLFLFELLKYFEGPTLEVIGAMVIPGAVFAVLFCAPLLHHVLGRRLAHGFVVAFVIGCVGCIGWLTVAALRADAMPPASRVQAARTAAGNTDDLSADDREVLRAYSFNQQRQQADRLARRAVQLAEEKGIPPAGPLGLLEDDPMTQGPRLFTAHCATCHRFDGHDGRGTVPLQEAASSDLGGFATQQRIRDFLRNPMDDRFFGRMQRDDGEPAHTGMADWVEENAEYFDRELDDVAAYLADEAINPGRLADAEVSLGDDDPIRRGRAFFLDECNECHTYQGERSGRGRGPEMYGYGSVAWIERMIANPAADDLFRDRGSEPAMMPSFADKLSERQRLLLAEWLFAASRDDRENQPE